MKWLTVLVVVIIVIVYAIVGAVIFSYLESDREQQVQRQFYSELDTFLIENPCITRPDIVSLKSLFNSMYIGGLIFDANSDTIINVTRWDYFTSIFVAVELAGTIGYPEAAPKSTGGRVFTVFFAIISIPLFILSAIGFGQLLNLGADLLLRLIARCRYGRREGLKGSKLLDMVYGPRRRRLYRTILITVIGFVLFVIIPSVIFMAVEGWSYGDAIYYCLLTLVTIGLGDFAPGYNRTSSWLAYGWYRLAVACWLLLNIGWFAGTVSAISSFILKVVERVEDSVSGALDDVVYQQQPPKFTVNQTGDTSVVTVLKNTKKSRLLWWRRFGETKSTSAGDVTAVVVKPRVTASTGDVKIYQDAPSHASVVRIGS